MALSHQVRGAGPPVVMIQGVGVHGDGWLPQVDALRDDFACLTFDHRGIGDSAAGAEEVSLPGMAEDTLALMDARGMDSAHLVGHSMGGLVALTAALQAPKRVRSLSLLCTFANGPATGALTWRMLWIGIASRVGTRAMRRRGFLRILLTPRAHRQVDLDGLAEGMASLFGHDLADQPAAVDRQLKAMWAWDVTDRLVELQHLPAAVLSGRWDPIARPALADGLATGLGAPHRVIEDASHGAPITHTEEVNAWLRAHLEEAERGRRWG